MTDTPEIGPTLQHFRKQRSLTLEQLAELSGVSKSMLSQIERGQANPTFAVLWGLTRALGVEISDLIEGSAGTSSSVEAPAIEISLTPEIKSADGCCTLRILSPPHLAGSMEWYELTIEAGGALDSAPHADGTLEHFTVLSGTFEIESGGAKRTLGPAETARYAADVAHAIRNLGETAAKGVLAVQFASERN